jgi:hypothetical protein
LRNQTPLNLSIPCFATSEFASSHLACLCFALSVTQDTLLSGAYLGILLTAQNRLNESYEVLKAVYLNPGVRQHPPTAALTAIAFATLSGKMKQPSAQQLVRRRDSNPTRMQHTLAIRKSYHLRSQPAHIVEHAKYCTHGCTPQHLPKCFRGSA